MPILYHVQYCKSSKGTVKRKCKLIVYNDKQYNSFVLEATVSDSTDATIYYNIYKPIVIDMSCSFLVTSLQLSIIFLYMYYLV